LRYEGYEGYEPPSSPRIPGDLVQESPDVPDALKELEARARYGSMI
jgi:hypothetical protein